MRFYSGRRPFVSRADRREKAQREMEQQIGRGRALSPVAVEGRVIARTFWGQAWCRNLESYSEFTNRLPRGRACVRNGSVIDLRVDPGVIHAQVVGSRLYSIEIKIHPLKESLWKNIQRECGGKIASLLELLQGRLSRAVMTTVCRPGEGLFPSPGEIQFSCSCPDWAGLCKHVAAALYGVGARLDTQPELLFQLRKVDHQELIAGAGSATVIAESAVPDHGLAAADLSEVFGIDIDVTPPAAAPPAPGQKSARRRLKKMQPTV